MTAPRVSVWISTRNAAPFIARCIDSLRAQTFTDYECVFIDDASTDDTYERAVVAMDSDPRFCAIRNVDRVRQVGAFLQAFPMLHGEILVELDGDDWLATPTSLDEIITLYGDGNGIVDATSGRPCYDDGGAATGFPSGDPSMSNFWNRLLHSYAPRTWKRSITLLMLASHPRAFYDPITSLPWASAGDVAIWAPACLSARRIASTAGPTYVINRNNPESDWKIGASDQVDCAKRIRDLWATIIPTDVDAQREFERRARARMEQIAEGRP